MVDAPKHALIQSEVIFALAMLVTVWLLMQEAALVSVGRVCTVTEVSVCQMLQLRHLNQLVLSYQPNKCLYMGSFP